MSSTPWGTGGQMMLPKRALTQLYFLEEKPTSQYPNVNLNAGRNPYIDTQGNMHVRDADQGASTSGSYFSLAGDS